MIAENKSITRDEALISLMLITNMRGEIVRQDYMFRLLTPLPNELKGNRLIDDVDGIPYTKKPRELMKELIKYPPFKQEYERYDRQFVMPEEPINLIYRAEKRVFVKSYYLDFKNAEVISKTTHGDRNVEFHIIQDGERYLVYLQKYDVRPAWRGLMWKEEAVAHIPMDLIHRAVEFFNKSYERFPPMVIEVKKVRGIKDKPYTNATIYRKFDRNPALDLDFSCYIVQYKKGAKVVGMEVFGDEYELKQIVEKIKGKGIMEEKGGVGIG